MLKVVPFADPSPDISRLALQPSFAPPVCVCVILAALGPFASVSRSAAAHGDGRVSRADIVGTHTAPSLQRALHLVLANLTPSNSSLSDRDCHVVAPPSAAKSEHSRSRAPTPLLRAPLASWPSLWIIKFRVVSRSGCLLLQSAERNGASGAGDRSLPCSAISPPLLCPSPPP